MVVIGLTGGIGSGKSTVSGFLADLGAVTLDADKVGHETLKPHTDVWRELVAAFGRGILRENEEIDRAKLGEIVFQDPEALKRLNGIVHPRMRRLMAERLEELRARGVEVVVLEAAILIEAKWTDLVDEVWVTVAPEETVVRRLRGKLTEDQVRSRLRSQMPPEERVKRADVVIDTDCDLAEVKARVEELWRGLRSRKVASV